MDKALIIVGLVIAMVCQGCATGAELGAAAESAVTKETTIRLAVSDSFSPEQQETIRSAAMELASYGAPIVLDQSSASRFELDSTSNGELASSGGALGRARVTTLDGKFAGATVLLWDIRDMGMLRYVVLHELIHVLRLDMGDKDSHIGAGNIMGPRYDPSVTELTDADLAWAGL